MRMDDSLPVAAVIVRRLFQYCICSTWNSLLLTTGSTTALCIPRDPLGPVDPLDPGVPGSPF